MATPGLLQGYPLVTPWPLHSASWSLHATPRCSMDTPSLHRSEEPVGLFVGLFVGASVGAAVGLFVGAPVDAAVGLSVGNTQEVCDGNREVKATLLHKRVHHMYKGWDGW